VLVDPALHGRVDAFTTIANWGVRAAAFSVHWLAPRLFELESKPFGPLLPEPAGDRRRLARQLVGA